MKYTLTAIACAVFVVGAGGIAVLSHANSTYTSPQPLGVNPVSSAPVDTAAGTPSTGATGSTPPSPKVSSKKPASAPAPTPANGYTAAMVASHNGASSCWTIINGNVYNLTTWINLHPGGPQAILSLCGLDGTAAFNAQHGGQGAPARELATFYMGPLVSSSGATNSGGGTAAGTSANSSQSASTVPSAPVQSRYSDDD
ncbi:MAG: hypothetical protein KGI59_02360 [Patescibacteria group bacterium]|nr:hypothetical protein [Patescibacteria group bacterium]MDE2172724.1 hypothetical protein [Patescibacteria group bacterium]